jgi:hypothetical protein
MNSFGRLGNGLSKVSPRDAIYRKKKWLRRLILLAVSGLTQKTNESRRRRSQLSHQFVTGSNKATTLHNQNE